MNEFVVGLIVFGIFGIVAASPFVLYRHIKLKMYFKKVLEMNSQQKQLEMMKLQTRLTKCKTNHVLHFLLCIPTLGVWIIMWALVSASNNTQSRGIEALMNTITKAAGMPQEKVS